VFSSLLEFDDLSVEQALVSESELTLSCHVIMGLCMLSELSLDDRTVLSELSLDDRTLSSE